MGIGVVPPDSGPFILDAIGVYGRVLGIVQFFEF